MVVLSRKSERTYLMGRFKDLTGQRFGRLTVKNLDHKEKVKNGSKTYWYCICECGRSAIIRTDHLTRNITHSCGCLERENIKNIGLPRHGQSNTKLYFVWNSMRQRCRNYKTIEYKNYGEKGVTYCKEWEKFEPFYDWALKNGYKEGLSIDRIDVNGNYEPSNCRWVTMKVQQNNRSNNRLIEWNGKQQTVSQWSDELEISYKTIESRLNAYGWSVEKTLTTK